MNYLQRIIGHFETHSTEGIRECFENGVNPNQWYKGKPLIYELINMYLRSERFKDCVRAFVDFGLQFDDKALLAVLLDDAPQLNVLLNTNQELLNKKYDFDCAFTPLYKASLLHICAEYNHHHCAKTLIEHGMDVNVKAGSDDHGFGAQPPIFHTVNQHANTCADTMQLLISKGADLSVTVKGLIWGKGYQWETFIPLVNPVSYAMMGLLPQFQRTEVQIYETISILLKAYCGISYFPANVPNEYLKALT
jgi:hypothetical protein